MNDLHSSFNFFNTLFLLSCSITNKLSVMMSLEDSQKCFREAALENTEFPSDGASP